MIVINLGCEMTLVIIKDHYVLFSIVDFLILNF